MRKGKDPCLLTDPDPGGPKTCGTGSPTMVKRRIFGNCKNVPIISYIYIFDNGK
jgi:hypothetical protein